MATRTHTHTHKHPHAQTHTSAKPLSCTLLAPDIFCFVLHFILVPIPVLTASLLSFARLLLCQLNGCLILLNRQTLSLKFNLHHSIFHCRITEKTDIREQRQGPTMSIRMLLIQFNSIYLFVIVIENNSFEPAWSNKG